MQNKSWNTPSSYEENHSIKIFDLKQSMNYLYDQLLTSTISAATMHLEVHVYREHIWDITLGLSPRRQVWLSIQLAIQPMWDQNIRFQTLWWNVYKVPQQLIL